MVNRPNIKVELGKKTAGKLIKIARKEFGQKGFKRTSMEQVVRLAGVTRGALYHHFENKEGLFISVFEKAMAEITDRCKEVQSLSSDPWEKLISTAQALFGACTDPEIQRIVFCDAPAILGIGNWRKNRESKTMVLFKDILTELIDQKIIKPLPLDALAHSIWGASTELIMWISYTTGSRIYYDEGFDTFVEILKSLKTNTK
jgi:AcrR family transcriptional regulator